MQRLSALLLAVLLMLCFPSYRATAQQTTQGTQAAKSSGVPRLNIRGTVYENQTLEPMPSAAVKLFNDKDSMIAGVLTAQNGRFLLPNIRAGKYTIKVSFVGYKEQIFGITLPERSGNFKVSDIMMREAATMMKEAVIEGKLPELTVVDDTVMYNADAFKLEDGAMVEELIKKLPGVVEETDGSYSFNGKPISQILVDGKEFFGNNRNMVLQNLPAEIVDKVKAYDKKSDRARITGIDDGEEKTVLDLAIKKNRKRGFFGRLDGAYGTKERYNGRMNFNRFKGDQKFSVTGNGNNSNGDGMTDNQDIGATMNWQNKVVELNGSVRGNFSQQSHESSSNSQNFEIRNSAYTNSHNWSSGNNKNFNFQYRIEWKPDSTWNILFRPEFSYGKNRNTNDSESAAFSDDPYVYSDNPLADYADFCKIIGVNHRRGSSVSSSHNINASASVQINKRLKKKGRNITLNMSGGYNSSNGESTNYSLTDYYQILAYDGGDSVYHKVQYNENPQKSYHMNAGISYSEPIAFQTYLQLRYEYNYNYRDNSREVRSIFDPYNDILGVNEYNYDDFFASPYTVRDKQQCNYTKNHFHNHNINLQLRVNRTRYELSIGGNIRPQASKIDYQKGRIDTILTRTVSNFSPTLFFRYKFSRQEQLNIRYNASTSQPNMTDMIPDTLSDANPLNIRIGNAMLKPSFTQNFNLDYHRSVVEYQRSSALNLQFRTTRNSTTNRTEYNEATGGRVSMPVNVNGNWNASANFNFNTALGPKKYWHISSGTSARFTNAVGFLYRSKDSTTVENTTRSGNFGQRLRLTYRRDWESRWGVEANLSGNFNYNLNRSTNASASNLDHHGYSFGGSFIIKTPWDMTISSDINENCRRGYSDDNMNTSRLIWNASISQRLLPHRILTLTLRAVDILGQRDDINRSVSATSRTDTQSEMVHSYVMFSAALRFGKFGGRGMRGRRL
ncbi:MAG: outer membrane beta-barrel protein [Bacteroidaceae bacterium]|nr:outer membrane beta-barrel protein [Bacteroidaceae bacterium]